MTTKLIGIVRVSTEGQAADDRAGLPRQRESINRVAASLGVPLEIVEVVGVSGSDLSDAPEWANVLKALDNDPEAHVVADSLDRLIRADGFNLRVFRDLRARARKVYTPGQVYDTMDPRDVMVLTMFAGLGGLDKAELKRKMQGGKESKRREGCWVGPLSKTPRGYDLRSQDPRVELQQRRPGHPLRFPASSRWSVGQLGCYGTRLADAFGRVAARSAVGAVRVHLRVEQWGEYRGADTHSQTSSSGAVRASISSGGNVWSV